MPRLSLEQQVFSGRSPSKTLEVSKGAESWRYRSHDRITLTNYGRLLSITALETPGSLELRRSGEPLSAQLVSELVNPAAPMLSPVG
jgi:hypothetical protein